LKGDLEEEEGAVQRLEKAISGGEREVRQAVRAYGVSGDEGELRKAFMTIAHTSVLTS
jgi:hypothetical protein